MKKILVCLVALAVLLCSAALADECKHLYEYNNDFVDATCTTVSSYSETCLNCGKVLVTKGEKTADHPWGTQTIIVNNGYKAEVHVLCSVCNEVNPSVESWKCNHKGTATKEVKVADVTCTTNGMYNVICLGTKEAGETVECGEIIGVRYETAQGHKLGKNPEVVYAGGIEDCVHAKTLVYTCENPWCNKSEGWTKSEPGEVSDEDHDWSLIKNAVTTANCEHPGTKTWLCLTCGAKKQKSEAKLGHDWKVTSETKADCTTEGVKVETCTRCNKTQETKSDKKPHEKDLVTEPVKVMVNCFTDGGQYWLCKTCKQPVFLVPGTKVPATGAHDFSVELDDKKNVAATCTTNGVQKMGCSTENCPATMFVYVPAAHTVTEWIEEKAPTCAEEGYEVAVCDECGAFLRQILAATNVHKRKNEKIMPTCDMHGIIRTTCTVCKATLNEEIDPDHPVKLGHEWLVVDIEDLVNCEQGAKANVVCARCETKDVLTLEASSHDFGDLKEFAPTCTLPGMFAQTCKKCGYVDVENAIVAPGKPALKHTEVVDAAVAATCTEAGKTEGKHCSVCNEVLVAQEEVAVLPHTEVVDAAVAATCTKTGLTEGKHCSVCETVLVAQEEVAALGHTEVEIAAVAPTCTEKGLTAGVKCSVCDAILTAQEEVAALGHTEVEIAAVAPTCTEKGLTAGVKCSVCNAVLTAQEEVAVLPHTEVEVAAVAATCTKDGLTAGKVCSVCEEVLVAQEVVDALGHEYAEEAEVIVPATCDEEGIVAYNCVRCDDCVMEAVEALGHDYAEEGEVTKAPTCTESGEMTYACTRCDDAVVETIEATGHDFGTAPVVPASCTAAGTTSTCANCNLAVVRPATGHKWVSSVHENNCGSMYVRYACKACGKKYSTAGTTSYVTAKYSLAPETEVEVVTVDEIDYVVYEVDDKTVLIPCTAFANEVIANADQLVLQVVKSNGKATLECSVVTNGKTTDVCDLLVELGMICD